MPRRREDVVENYFWELFNFVCKKEALLQCLKRIKSVSDEDGVKILDRLYIFEQHQNNIFNWGDGVGEPDYDEEYDMGYRRRVIHIIQDDLEKLGISIPQPSEAVQKFLDGVDYPVES